MPEDTKPSPKAKSRLDELIAEKISAGLSKEDARTCAEAQIEHDASQAKQTAKAT